MTHLRIIDKPTAQIFILTFKNVYTDAKNADSYSFKIYNLF